jgi:hypothetical protein
VKSSNQTTFLKEKERKYWQDLVDSNIRTGTLACLWCLKAQAIKKLSLAFNKWRLVSALKSYESNLLQQQSKEDPSEVVEVMDNAISIINRYKDGGFLQTVDPETWKPNSASSPSAQSKPATKGIDFPWEERRKSSDQEGEHPGINPDTIDYVNQNVSPDLLNHAVVNLDQYQSNYNTLSSTVSSGAGASIRDQVDTATKEWSFIQLSSTLLDQDLDVDAKRKILCKSFVLLWHIEK